MATKAQQFLTEARLNRPKRAPQPKPKPKRRSVSDDGAQNLTRQGEKRASVVTEESHSGKRSRKSSRKSQHHGKNSTTLEYAARMKSQSPQHKHAQR